MPVEAHTFLWHVDVELVYAVERFTRACAKEGEDNHLYPVFTTEFESDFLLVLRILANLQRCILRQLEHTTRGVRVGNAAEGGSAVAHAFRRKLNARLRVITKVERMITEHVRAWVRALAVDVAPAA